LIDGIYGMSDEFENNLLSSLVFEGMVFRAGAAALQYRFLAADWNTSVDAGINFDTSTKQITLPAGRIKHETLQIQGQSLYWTFDAFASDALTAGKTYYLYLLCSKNLEVINNRLTGLATPLISDQKLRFDDSEEYYTLWVAFINSENSEGDRSFSEMYGLTELLPGQLTVDTIKSSDGGSFLDFLRNRMKIGGANNYLAWNVVQGLLEIVGASLEIKDAQGNIISSIDGATGAAVFGKGSTLLNADGSGQLANGNISWDANGNPVMQGKVISVADNGDKIILDATNNKLSLEGADGKMYGILHFESSDNFRTAHFELFAYDSDGNATNSLYANGASLVLQVLNPDGTFNKNVIFLKDDSSSSAQPNQINGRLVLPTLPTSPSGLGAGMVYRNGANLCIV
jgi:hypothetical protein